MNVPSKKLQAYERGVQAEQVAALYLRGQGYDVLEERYKTPVGEIDLIVGKGERIIFAEVKSHKSEEQALLAVTARSRRRIEAAAEHYIAHHEGIAGYEMRFDVLVVPPEILKRSGHLANNLLGAVSVRHLDNAWLYGQ